MFAFMAALDLFLAGGLPLFFFFNSTNDPFLIPSTHHRLSNARIAIIPLISTNPAVHAPSVPSNSAYSNAEFIEREDTVAFVLVNAASPPSQSSSPWSLSVREEEEVL
jgi:hypothetical protein